MCVCSNYPSNRVKKEEDGDEVGVMGNVQLVQNVVLSSQPISSIDWSPDKVNHTHSLCATPIISLLQEGLLVSSSFDQTVRVCIVTKLNTL